MLDGDELKKINPGDSPAVLLDAERFNLLSDVGNWYRSRTGGQIGIGPEVSTAAFPRLEVWIRSATTLAQFAVVRPTGTMTELNPAGVGLGSDFIAQAQPAFDVAAPAADTDLVFITTGPVPGGTGVARRAIIQGVAVVDVNHTDTGHAFAKPIAGDTTKLASAASGSILLLPQVGAAALGTRKRLVLLTGGTAAAAAGALTYGEAVMPADYTLSAVDAWENTGFALTIPAAGVYLVLARAYGLLNVNTFAGFGPAHILCRLTDTVAAAVVSDSYFEIVEATPGNTEFRNNGMMQKIVNVAAPTTLRLDARTYATTATNAKQVLKAAPSGGNASVMSYVKVG